VPDMAIQVRGLRRRYAGVDAVAGIDLDVRSGEIFAFLGPNGAGKTTTVEILEGFRERTSGEVSVLGADPAHFSRADRARLGCVLQEGDLEPRLTPHELVELWASYFPHPRPVAEVLELAGIADRAGVRIERLSGGQKRRVELALALVGRPELLFLDEPTTGFDPEARRAAWEVIAGLRDLGTTVFLTTHYLEEAERLADRVAIIKGGTIVAAGAPAELTGDRRPRISFRLPDGVPDGELPAALAGAAREGGRVELATAHPTAVLAEVCGWAAARELELEELSVARPELEDVYLALTDGR